MPTRSTATSQINQEEARNEGISRHGSCRFGGAMFDGMPMIKAGRTGDLGFLNLAVEKEENLVKMMAVPLIGQRRGRPAENALLAK